MVNSQERVSEVCHADLGVRQNCAFSKYIPCFYKKGALLRVIVEYRGESSHKDSNMMERLITLKKMCQ